jgi:hypothetical protein
MRNFEIAARMGLRWLVASASWARVIFPAAASPPSRQHEMVELG